MDNLRYILCVFILGYETCAILAILLDLLKGINND